MESLAEHLRAQEEALLDPEVRKNRAALEKLLCENFVEFGSSGRIWTRDRIIELLAEEVFSPVRMEAFHCAPLGENVALVTYRATSAEPGAQTASLRSSIWVRESREWRLRFHQGTRTT